MIKKGIALVWLLIGLFMTSISFAHQRANISWLYVINTDNATMTPINPQKNEYHVALKTNKVYFFAERPSRMVGSFSVPDFIKTWNEGKNSFQKDKPNTALTGIPAGAPEEQINLVFKMEQPVYDSKTGQLAFDIKILRGAIVTENLRDVTMFIDAAIPCSSCSTTGFASWAGADQGVL